MQHLNIFAGVTCAEHSTASHVLTPAGRDLDGEYVVKCAKCGKLPGLFLTKREAIFLSQRLRNFDFEQPETKFSWRKGVHI